MPVTKTLDVAGVPLRGGAVTVREKGLLRPGTFSMVQNVRAMHPGFRKRKGQRALHTTADSTNQAMSAYQFKKTRVTENLYLVQMSDGDILSLTTVPPGVTTGAMGSELWSGTTAPIPASWSNLNDMLVVSNGVDQHQLYPGSGSYPDKFIVYTTGASDITGLKGILEDGIDFSEEVSDAQSTTYAEISNLDDKDAGDGIFICTPVPAKSFTFTISAANGTADRVLSLYYWRNTSVWQEVSGFSDGTTSGTTCFAQTGTMTWTEPTDIQERLLFGKVGYWYLLVIDANTIDAEVKISAVTYDASFHSMKVHWDGVPQLAPIVLVYDGTADLYSSYSGASVDLDSLDASGAVYVLSADPIEGIYLDCGETPDADAQTIESVSYWSGSAWTGLTVLSDGSNGNTNPGWVTINRPSSVPPQPRAMKTSKVWGYWYQIVFTDNVAADVTCQIYTMPYYDIHDWGYVGQCSCAWKERMLYTFTDKFQEYVYITPADMPQVLVSEDAGVIQVGDGRPHKVTAIKTFFNNVLVWQEEKGSAGGCVTMLQGYDQPTFGKLVLSTKLGTFSQKSVDVVENVYTSTATDEELKTVAFFLSRIGVVACDGNAFSVISDDIQNYFDINESTTCIRHGYESQMWLKHDPIDHVLRIGLVCGASATTPNVFPVYDLIDKCWYFDVRAQELSFWENVDSGSGNYPITQIGGGVDDGILYQVNYGTADVSTAIETYITAEIPGYGEYLDLLWMSLTCKAQTGTITVTPYKNGIAETAISLDSAAEVATQEVKRNMLSVNYVDQHLALKISNSSATESMTLMTLGLEVRKWINR